VRLTRRAIPHMLAANAGRIVNITSLSTLQPLPRFGLSVATWGGVLGYAKTLSLEIATRGITVNTICPGRIATGRLATVFGESGQKPDDEALLNEVIKGIPMRRVGSPDEIAALVAFLCSAHAAYITGSVFHVDGGRRANVV
jgi:3-oxoacyl-[acyl-carrier protein] reductase